MINLRLSHPDDTREAAAIQARLNELFPGLSFLETKDVTEANQMIGLLKKVNWSISVIALLMGVFFILNTLLMAVNERIREIGILAALGWRKMRIMAMVMFEGMLLAALGSAAGLLIGLAGLHRLASLKHLQGFIDPTVSSPFPAGSGSGGHRSGDSGKPLSGLADFAPSGGGCPETGVVCTMTTLTAFAETYPYLAGCFFAVLLFIGCILLFQGAAQADAAQRLAFHPFCLDGDHPGAGLLEAETVLGPYRRG